MESTTISGIQSQQSTEVPGASGGLADLDLDAFLSLLITELQNQDPLNPMENTEILQQVSQIREIQTNMSMTETFESVTLAQNTATAARLLGQTVKALDDQAEEVTGRVDRVTISDGESPKLHVGEHVISLKNVSEITTP